MARSVAGSRLSAERGYSTADCFYFDGVDDYIEVPDNDNLSITTTGEITISAWIRIVDYDMPNGTYSSDGNYVMYLGKGENGAYEYGFRMYNKSGSQTARPQRISFYVFNDVGGTGVGSFNQAPILPGEWVHVVGSVDATSTYFYKNGVLKDSDVYTASVTPVNTTTPFRMGSIAIDTLSDPYYFKGFIRDVRVWNRKLTDGEVTSLYAGTDVTSGLVAKWLLNEKGGSTVIDSVSGLNGTAYGAIPSDGRQPVTRSASGTRTAA